MASLLNVGTGVMHDLPSDGVTIGRDSACAIVVDGEGISRRHVRIAPSGEHYALLDESTNGVFVNGERATASQTLADGDVIRIGDAIFRFGAGNAGQGAAVEPSAPSDGPSRLTGDAISPITAPMPRRRAERGAPALLATLDVVQGSVPHGMRFRVERPIVQLGRDAASDVCLLDPSVSGSHATLMLRGDRWHLLDHASFNGTYVDGVRVSQCALPGACDLRLGGVTLRFRPVAR